jgi:glycosyltransferase involved in cell wall biosynthesis
MKSAARRYFVYDYHIAVARRFAGVATREMARRAFDVVVAPTSITEIAFLETDLPIVLLEDATFALLHNYYHLYAHIPRRAVRQLDAATRTAINKASLLVYSSAWAGRSAIEDYGADPHKVHVVPMGANLAHPPGKEVVQQRKNTDRCRLLLVGVDWQRKGGQIAFETLLKLEELGLDAELTICGCVPPDSISHQRMRVIPFLDKHDEHQRRELEQLYLTSDFLLLPTRSEAYGIVFCEAAAFGLPAITTATGGVAEVVRDGENGYALPLSAGGAEYALLIAQIHRDDRRYFELVRSSRAAYDARLNWESWGVTMSRLLAGMLGRGDNEERDAAGCRHLAD